MMGKTFPGIRLNTIRTVAYSSQSMCQAGAMSEVKYRWPCINPQPGSQTQQSAICGTHEQGVTRQWSQNVLYCMVIIAWAACRSMVLHTIQKALRQMLYLHHATQAVRFPHIPHMDATSTAVYMSMTLCVLSGFREADQEKQAS